MGCSGPTARRWPAVARGVVATSATASAAVVCGVVARRSFEAVAALPGARPDEAVVLVAAGLASVVFGWLAVLLLSATLAALPGALGALGRRVARHVAPSWGRRLTAVVLGVVVVSSVGSAGAAVASTTVSRVVPTPALPSLRSGPAVPDPGWTAPPPPRRHAGARTALVTTAPRPGWGTGESVDEVVVRRGDSLWAVAARHLGPDASPAHVAAEWPRWYAANRHLIGDDPSRILPGQVLQAPGSAS